MTITIDEAVQRAQLLLHRPGRHLLGLTGAPGAGKSTLAAALCNALGPAAIVVPMDGFHLADVALDSLGLRSWKGRIDTFDGWGYVALLRRLREEVDHDVFAPAFERDLEQPLAGAICVPATIRLVITEGNYLLADAAPWSSLTDVLDEVWFCNHGDEDDRRGRLLERHILFGKLAADAAAWIERVDEPNARLVASTSSRATVSVRT